MMSSLFVLVKQNMGCAKEITAAGLIYIKVSLG